MAAVAEPSEALRPTAHPAYAYGPRPRPSPHARYHAVLDRPLVAGRFRREAGEALCKPATRFWGLALVTTAPVTCPRCLELAERHGVELIDSTTEAGR